MTQKFVGLIGCGRMGIGLCRNLVLKGYSVIAYDLDEQALQSARDLGARRAADLDDLIATCSAIITCLPTIEAIKATYTGSKGLLHTCVPGTLLIETSSADPAQRRSFGELASQRELELVDAPMLRSAADAWKGTVQILLGGEPAAVARARPYIEAVSEKIISAGRLGDAHVMKALNNAVAMTNHAILGEIFTVAQHLGIDGSTLFEMMRGSMAASYKLEDLVPKLLANNHPRNAKLAFIEKDLAICCDAARDTPVLTPVLDSAYLTYRVACRMGGSEEQPSRLASILCGSISQSGDPALPSK